EGVRAALDADGADHAEFAIFDGKGNESVVVVAADDDGRTAEGTGPSSAEAMKDAKTTGDRRGRAFGPPSGHETAPPAPAPDRGRERIARAARRARRPRAAGHAPE